MALSPEIAKPRANPEYSWESLVRDKFRSKDKSPAKWIVADDILTVSKATGVGNIETKQTFKDYQLHIE